MKRCKAFKTIVIKAQKIALVQECDATEAPWKHNAGYQKSLITFSPYCLIFYELKYGMW
jgi:hypothetical protein